MNFSDATIFFAGVSLATFTACGVFFLKLWLASRDRFFLFFSGACTLIAVERVVAMCLHGILCQHDPVATEKNSWIYLIRLCAFALILVAIVEKNRKKKRP